MIDSRSDGARNLSRAVESLEQRTLFAVPAAPTEFFAIETSSTTIRLQWKDNASDEASYRVYQATSASGPFRYLKRLPANTELFTVGNLTATAHYYYRLRAANADGFSTIASADTTTPGPDGAGNSATTARKVTLGSKPWVFHDWAGESDRNDYYKFVLTRTTHMQIVSDQLIDDIDLQLRKLLPDGHTAFVAAGDEDEGVNPNSSLDLTLEAGTYFARMFPVAHGTNPFVGNSDYRISFTASAPG